MNRGDVEQFVRGAAGLGISPSLLYTWRRAFRAERVGSLGVAPGFVPAMIIPETRPDSGASPSRRMEIVVAKGHHHRGHDRDRHLDATPDHRLPSP